MGRAKVILILLRSKKNKEHIITDQNEVLSCLVIKREKKNINIVNI
jgi:hypothetical protein